MSQQNNSNALTSLQSNPNIKLFKKAKNNSKEKLLLKLKKAAHKNNLVLKTKWSNTLGILLIIQLIAVNLIVVAIGLEWLKFEKQTVMVNIFVGGTFIQICGLVIVVIRHLFPKHDD